MPISDQIFEDYINDRLDDQQEAKMRTYMRDHPEEAREIEELKTQNLMLKELGADILEEPVPERLKQLLPQARKK